MIKFESIALFGMMFVLGAVAVNFGTSDLVFLVLGIMVGANL